MTEPPAPASDAPPYRYNARLANEIEAKWQDRWERRPHVLGAEPDRPARATGSTPSRRPSTSSTCSTCSRTRAATGLHVGHPLGLHRHRRVRAVHAHERPQRAPRDGLRRVRPPGRAVRGASTGSTRASPPTRTSPTMRRQLRALGLGHDPRRSVATTDVAVLPLDAVDLPADLRLLVRRRARTGPVRSPSSSPSSRPARARPRATPTPTSWRGPSSTRRRAPRVVDSYRLAYLDEALVNWCPALGTVLANEEVTADGRSDRGNHPVFRRPLEAVDAADHRVRRPAARRSRPARLARVDQDDAAQLDRAQRRRHASRSRSRSTRASTSRCSRRAPTRCSAPRTWCSRPSTRWSTRSCPSEWPDATLASDVGDMPAAWKGIFGIDELPPEAVRRYREFAAQKSELERQAEGREKTGVFTGAFAKNPTNGWNDPDLRRRLRAHGLRHRRDHGGARARPARLRVRPASSTCPIVGVVQPPDGWLRDRGLDADTPARRVARGVRRRRRGHELVERRRVARRAADARGEAADRRVARGERARRRRGHLQAARLAVQPPALLGRAVPDRLRRRRATPSRCRSRCCRSSCPR